MAVTEIYNTFPGELGFINEVVSPWKVGLFNTTMQEVVAQNPLGSLPVLAGGGMGVAAD